MDKCYDLTSNNYINLKNKKNFYCKAYEKWLLALECNSDKLYNDKYKDMKLQLYNSNRYKIIN